MTDMDIKSLKTMLLGTLDDVELAWSIIKQRINKDNHELLRSMVYDIRIITISSAYTLEHYEMITGMSRMLHELPRQKDYNQWYNL